jgi:hypothetical protein
MRTLRASKTAWTRLCITPLTKERTLMPSVDLISSPQEFFRHTDNACDSWLMADGRVWRFIPRNSPCPSDSYS